MDRDQIRSVVTVELRKGTPAQDICDMAISSGVSSAAIRGVFMDLLPYDELRLLELPPDDKLVTKETLRHDQLVKDELAEQEKAKRQTIPPEKNVFWDPVLSDVYLGKFSVQREAMRKKFKFYHEHGYILKLVVLGLSLIGCVTWAVMAYWWYIDLESAAQFLFGEGDDDGLFWILLLCWAPLFMFLAYVKSLQADLVKERIAEQKEWVYNPDSSASHWSLLRKRFPRIFAQGTEKQSVQDEIWGRYKKGNQDIDFYSGIFEYHIVTGTGKRRRKSRHYQTFFGIRLNKQLKKDLELTPNSAIKKIFKSIFSRKMELESVNFNEIYSVEYGGGKDEKLDIFKMLTPAVQWELIRLGKEVKGLRILFSGDTFLFVQDGFLFQKKQPNFLFKILFSSVPFARKCFLRQMNSNFIKRVEVSPKDEAFLVEKIESLLSIATEVPQYLD